MNDVIKDLELHYAFARLEVDWGFFYNMAKYVEFVIENPETNKIIEGMDREKKDVELWNAWESLHIVYISIDDSRYSEEMEKLKKDKTKNTDLISKLERTSRRLKEAHAYRPHAFNSTQKQIYKSSVLMVQNHLIEKLSNAREEDKREENSLILANTKSWEDIEIKFKDEYEIEVFKKEKLIEKIDYIKMEFFKGLKEKRPDRQWQFLILLSLLQGKNEKNATNNKMAKSLSDNLGKEISINNCESIKKNLSKKLSKIFGIDDDPFYNYKDHGYYKTKFTLKPVPLLRGDGEVYITKREEFNDEIDYSLPKKGYHKTEY